MNNFLKRTLTGAIFITVLIGSILWSSYTFGILFFIIVILGINEFYTLVSKETISPQKIWGIISGAAIFALFYLNSSGLLPQKVLAITILFPVVSMIIELYRKKENPFTNISYTILGIVYIALSFGSLCYIVHTPELSQKYSPERILGVLFLIWTNDTFAYLTGMTFGKRRLWERISPKKSWEGSIGGFIFTLGLAYILSLFFNDLSLIDWLIIGGIMSVIGTYGDLTESLLKRSLNIKDSGNILPGHGGILDRFDSLILAAPVVFMYLQIKSIF